MSRSPLFAQFQVRRPTAPDTAAPAATPARAPAPRPTSLGQLPAETLDTDGWDPLRILSEVFGYHAFRGGQEEIVRHVTDGNDALVLMPTGGGKSLCYQVPALARPGMAVVVSPLLALMYDQVVRLRENGVAAAMLNSDLTSEEQASVVRDARAGRIKLLYVAPERLVMDSFLNLISSVPLSLFAIDEAHCVSQWGHNFRTEYKMLGEICGRFPDVPRIAVTATASPHTQDDMIRSLDMERARQFVSSFDRPNITYTIAPAGNRVEQLLEFLQDHRGESGVIYCMRRKDTERIAQLLREHGFDAFHFHAQLSENQSENSALKREAQDRFTKGEGVIAVATIAFGMGIDKPDVRFVAHMALPESLEAYYQETGRGGRDGLPSTAWMVCSPGEAVQRRQNILNDPKHGQGSRRLALGRLQALTGMIESAECRRASVLRYFGEAHSGRCGNCDRCLNPVATFDGTRETRMILSAAARTGERFGGGHLVEVLTGSRNERILRFGHDKLPTFGVGSDRTQDWWRHVVNQVLTADLLCAPPELQGGYRLTEEGRAVMRGEGAVRLVEPPKRGKGAPRAVQARRVDLVEGLPSERIELFEGLKAMRAKHAKAYNMPPFTIFHDQTLIDIVTAMPDTLDQLGRISGIGTAKLSRYGTEVLSIVEKHRKPVPQRNQIAIPGFGPRM